MVPGPLAARAGGNGTSAKGQWGVGSNGDEIGCEQLRQLVILEQIISANKSVTMLAWNPQAPESLDRKCQALLNHRNGAVGSCCAVAMALASPKVKAPPNRARLVITPAIFGR